MIIYLVASYYLPHNIIHAGKWCDALRMVIKEGYRHAGFDVNVETFDLDGDDVDEDEDVKARTFLQDHSIDIIWMR